MDAPTKRIVDLGGTQPRHDWCVAVHAYALAEEIRQFWKKRGAEIAVRVEQIRLTASPESENVKILYAVRSNLVGGSPRGWTAEKLIKAEQS